MKNSVLIINLIFFPGWKNGLIPLNTLPLNIDYFQFCYFWTIKLSVLKFPDLQKKERNVNSEESGLQEARLALDSSRFHLGTVEQIWTSNQSIFPKYIIHQYVLQLISTQNL